MHGHVIVEVAAVAIALVGGFALGAIFGRMLVSDLAATARSLQSRVSSVEHAVGAGKAQATHAHAAALERHAQATEKLAAAVAASASTAAPGVSAKRS
jgi:uncharacterized membrane-anchored protein YhcB (DUF1043 family)